MILDTNVVSLAMRVGDESAALRWLNAQEQETLFITSITIAEIEKGIAILPEGQRKSALLERFRTAVVPVFQGRIISFDANAASEHAHRYANARSRGIAVDFNDGYISGIAAANKMTVATRDTIPFEAMGIKTINPWES